MQLLVLQEQAHVIMTTLSQSLTSAAATAVSLLLALTDSDLAISADGEGDEAEEDSEVFGARAAMLRVYHLLLVAQPVSVADRNEIIKQASHLLQVCSRRHLPGSRHLTGFGQSEQPCSCASAHD